MFYFRDISTLMLFLTQWGIYVDFSSDGLTLPQCVGNKAAIELDENKSNQVITCTDVRAIDVVSVYRIDANNVKSFILKCDTSNQCPDNAESNIYSAMRGSNVVNVTIIVVPVPRSFFGVYTMSFEAVNGNNTDEGKCDLDVVNKPNMIACNAQFITNRTEWLVIGKCIIDKVFSYRDRYACMWNEINGMSTTAIPNNQTTLKKTLISGTSRNDFYYSLECSFSKSLPEMSGIYNYTVIIFPGDIHLTINFTGSNSIDPPTFPPSIVNYSDNDVVYSGDFLNMTCIVKGGLPLNATKVNFICSGKPDGNDTFGNDEVNSTITFTQLNDNDLGRVCICTAKWKNYTWYTQSAQRTLNVYYPPQRPNITERNKPMFPYLEGEYVHLSCDLIFKGNPPANLSWSFYRTANNSRTNDTSVQLDLQSLGKNDNNKIVTCSAENNFTQTKGSTVMSAFVLQVYYRPILELREGEDNACIFTSELWQCAVTEGRRIDIHCIADSNPVSGEITWHNVNWTSVNFTNSSQLYIPSTNKSEHNGIFTCRAFTIKPNISDTRLPLNSTKDLYVLVKYMPCDINLILKTTATSITVMEKEVVTFVCRSNGRPTPTVILFNQDNSTQLFRVQGGVLSLADEITTMNYTIPHASCEDTGNYACSGENGVGKLQSNNASLRVNCEPRFFPGSWQPNIITFRGEPIIATFELIAFPKIQTVYTSKLGNNCTHVYPLQTFSWTCDETKVPYKSVCRFLITNATTCDAGIYQLTFVNGIGQLNITIQLQVMPQYSLVCENHYLGAGAGAGITLAVVAIVVAIVLVILRHHRWVLPCSDTNIKSYRNTELLDSITFSKIRSQIMDEINRTAADENTITVLEADAHPGSMYDSLKVEEIAVVSEYESISQQNSNDQKHFGQPCAKATPNRVYANIPLKEMPC